MIWKQDVRIIPLSATIYLLCFLDRSNIGNARIAGMSRDLHLEEGDRYDWLLTVFYISYIVFQFQIMYVCFVSALSQFLRMVPEVAGTSPSDIAVIL